MDYEDRMTIETPEGVVVEVALAGIGSRLTAAFLDGLIQLVVLGALIWISFAAFPEPTSGEDLSAFLIIFAIVNLLLFIVLFSYHAVFEAFWSGRTPGKKAAGLRVVQVGGRPIDVKAALVRNLMRLVDILPGMYGVAIVAILATGRNQRLGDLVAGTMVIREQTPAPLSAPEPVAPMPGLETWDVSTVTTDELATVQRFLIRRRELSADARAQVAKRIADGLRPKVAGAPLLRAEEFLEQLALAKSARV